MTIDYCIVEKAKNNDVEAKRNIEDSCKETIERLHNYYLFLGITQEKFDLLAQRIMGLCITSYHEDSNINFVEYFEKTLVEYINKYITNNKKNFLIIINNFIAQHLKAETTDEKESLTELIKLEKFITSVNFDGKIDFYIDLLANNENVCNFVKDIIDKNNIANQIEELTNYSIISILIEAYSMINDTSIDIYDIAEDGYYSDDSFKMYCSEIKKFPLLDQQEFIILFNKYKNGDMQAKNQIINSNLRLVISVATKYIRPGLSILDLVQEGNIGLMTALERFDITKGYKFSTYAIHWIRCAITKFIYNHSRNIRIPSDVYRKLRKYKTAINYLTVTLEREPTIEEIASYMNITIADVQKLDALQHDTISVNQLIDSDSTSELIDFISDTESSLDEFVILSHDIEHLFKKASLSDRECEIISLKYGLGGNKSLTYAEIGHKYGISRQRVEQIIKKLLTRLRRVYLRADYNAQAVDLIKKSETLNLYIYFNKKGYSRTEVNNIINKFSREERIKASKLLGSDLSNISVPNQNTPHYFEFFSFISLIEERLNNKKNLFHVDYVDLEIINVYETLINISNHNSFSRVKAELPSKLFVTIALCIKNSVDGNIMYETVANLMKISIEQLFDLLKRTIFIFCERLHINPVFNIFNENKIKTLKNN